MIDPPPRTTTDVEEALALHGMRARSIALVSTLKERKGRRWAYRVDTDDGRTVKARLFESAEAALGVFELRARLEEAFAPALARHGAVLIEEWVAGAPLAERDWHSRIEEAGALLGRLHGLEAAPASSTARRREDAEAVLDRLEAAGNLSRGEGAALRAEMARRDPGEAGGVIAHLDLCADNMLVDASRRLRVIDNELVCIAPAGLDLARTFDLWPMPAALWRRFRLAYDRTAPADPGAAGFWRIVTALASARIFGERSEERFAAALARLRRYAAGEDLAER
jgi:Ser/Thr protein kinase RdoA (MazF antagonist)